jgi:hypothetical protein
LPFDHRHSTRFSLSQHRVAGEQEEEAAVDVVRTWANRRTRRL